ncbi:hypothetical protein E8E13_000469 [Curvularia kusanoi]|uniref:CRAL-TRIO domain-containing protein n=1 Tax=Curvularia kusanoi TaxID=90978 RepID=A0A9P4TLM8_CURKU|nr:hypothetical protein E8E13_000469 [Curvularia kusanoi]
MLFLSKTSSSSSEKTVTSGVSTQSAEPGTVGNLTLEQERCLQEAWIHILRLCGYEKTGNRVPDKSNEFLLNVKNISPDGFKDALWNYMFSDNPDGLVLRFLRARKWDVTKAIEMLVSAIDWREERKINTNIIRGGESVGLKAEKTPDEEAFMMQYRSGKSYVRGNDKCGHPVYVIRVKLHDPNKQPAHVMESFALHNIEMLRIMAKSRQDKATLVFDLTGFGLRNMDFHFVKFLIHMLEARYPETLKMAIVHNAPFVFWGIWNVIKHWLDPVIASKIHFTSGNKGMHEFIPRDNLQKCFGGDDDWEYKYVEPTASENEQLYDAEKKGELLDQKTALINTFNQLTVEWATLELDGSMAKAKDDQRRDVAQELERKYWQLDPHIRSTTYYDRVGVLTRDGVVDFTAAR